MLLPPQLLRAARRSVGISCGRHLFPALCNHQHQQQHNHLYGIYRSSRCVHTEVCAGKEEEKGALSDLESELVVVGCGQMGTGIALTAARHLAGTRVTLLDISKTQLQRGRKFSELWVQKEVGKGKLEPAAAESLLQRLSFIFLDPEVLISLDASAAPEAVRRSTFCLESASENLAIKRNIFALLDSAAPPTAVLATNTSSISITKIAAATRSPHRVIGMHFMNPVPVMPLVEIISGLDTDENTKLRTEQLAFQMKKTTAHALDRPGFVANRLLMPYLNEAVFALQVNEGLGCTGKAMTESP
ncbi:3-hydroxybutyryl-coA dehydrogenase, putative [Eimeria mitis]|uniref:3-hydroxybutyryl-coA dehydrogenase, putative n=1 Tax=Eimeria mitis TaxID=44415 RepID=U6K915_9EIME|nr:3-hydroxybutyryl-coA dehydrogenase, putative [Eimeria mitis]CDJ34424.1 3-hydroxybutyryl-coA dehydrogenase, putative [Eimeria mitis]